MKICPSCKTDFGGGEVFCPNDGSRLISASQWDGDTKIGAGEDPLVGTILSERYKILRQIGEGGMGLVYEAEHVAIEKRVALKVLRDDFSRRQEVVARFRQEAKSASKIGNEHIVDISDFGTTPTGASYFVMELLNGEDLAETLAEHGHLPVSRAADIIMQCCTALGAAHSKGIVHRDMKPENIFLTERDGRRDFVKLVDFGIAKMSDIETEGAPGRKLTKTGMIFGTPEYMSPEQAAGKELDHRVDIYALAVIFFEMLTGQVPFVGDTFMGILTQHMFEDPPSIFEVNSEVDIPEQIAAFIYRGMAKDPDERYQSCDEMAEALGNALAGQFDGTPTFVGYGDPVRASHQTARTFTPQSAETELPVRRPASKLGIAALAVAVVLAAGVGAGVVWWVGKSGDGDPPITVADPPEAGEDAGGLVIGDPPRLSADAGGPPVAEGEPDAGPTDVTVTVTTSPVGARVFVEGRGEVCEATPCSFETAPGEPITVRASRGRNQGETEIAPTENTTLQIAMRRVAASRGGRRNGRQGSTNDTGSAGQTGGRRGGSGDLKIPDIFRNQ